MRFLKQHPDVKAEFDAFDPSMTMEPDTTVTFHGKADLKKNGEDKTRFNSGIITPENYEQWFIAYAEGDLSDTERHQTESFVKTNPSYAREFKIFNAIRLSPESDIHYPAKDSLKQRKKKRSMWLPQYFAYAAAIAILFGIFQLTKQNEPARQTETITTLAVIDAGNIRIDQPPAGLVPEETTSSKNRAMVVGPALEKPAIRQGAIHPVNTIKSEQLVITQDAPLGVAKRFDLTSEYYYQTVQEDLEYLVAYKDYKQKNFFGKLAYRVGHRIAPGDSNFIIDPDFSLGNILSRGVYELNELATIQHIKSDFFELKYKRSRRDGSESIE